MSKTRNESYARSRAQNQERKAAALILIQELKREDVGHSIRSIAQALGVESNCVSAAILSLRNEGSIVATGIRWDDETKREQTAYHAADRPMPSFAGPTKGEIIQAQRTEILRLNDDLELAHQLLEFMRDQLTAADKKQTIENQTQNRKLETAKALLMFMRDQVHGFDDLARNFQVSK